MASTAIITGASRGLGLALARALAARQWRLVIDARGADALEAARRELAALTDVTALVGDVADERHRRALVTAAGDRIDALVNNASVLGPSPQPSLDAYPLDVLERRLRGQRAGAAAPRPAGAARHARRARGSSTSPPTPPSRPTRAGAATAPRRRRSSSSPSVLAAERPPLARLRLRPGRHEHAMHQEAFPGEDISDRPPPEDSVPGAARAADRRPAERALRRRRPEGRSLSAAARLRAARAPRGPRAARGAGLARDDVRMLVARGDGRLTHARARDLPDFLRAGRPRRHQHLGHAARRAPARRADGTGSSCTSPRRCPAPATTAGSSSCARGAEPFRGGRAGDVLDLPGGARATLEAPYLGRRAPVGRAPGAPRAAAGLPRPPRRADPLPLRPRRPPARRPTRRPTPPSPAAPRCRAPGAR